MQDYIKAKARYFRKWLLGEARSEIRATQDLQWITRHIKVPIPYTVVSLQPSTMAWIINDIIINDRRTIVELGAGSSTQLIGHCLKLLGEDTTKRTFISIEEHEGWTQHVKQVLVNDGIENHVKLVHAERVNYGSQGSWYNEVKVREALGGRKVDCLVVDGPSVKNSREKTDRFRSYEFFKDHLHTDYTVFIDDTFRPAEKALLKHWAKAEGQSWTTMNAYLGVVIKDKKFTSRPY